MRITIIQAIDMAIQALKDLPETEETSQAIIRLTNLKEKSFYVKWSKEMVFEKLDQWKKEHGRNPTTTNLAEVGMPKSTQIQRLFDMRPSAFFNIYYPNDKRKSSRSPYTVKSKEEYVSLFVDEYNLIKPKSGNQYNAQRSAGMPTWNTIAKYIGVSTWNELLQLTDVDTSHLSKTKTQHSFVVKQNVELYEELLNCLGEEYIE